MDAMAGGEPDGPPVESRRPEGEPPLVVALPVGEAMALLRQAGWDRVEVRSTSAPPRRPDTPTGFGEGGEWFVVRQRRADAVIRLTVAAHPGGPWRPGEGAYRA